MSSMHGRDLRVVICGTPDVYRAGLVAVLRETPGIEVLGVLDGATYCVNRLRELRPDILLLDLDAFADEPMVGLRAVRMPTDLPVKVIVLSSSPSAEAALDVLRSGAQGVLRKNVAVRYLIEAIHAVDQGEVALAPQTARHLVETLRFGIPPSPVAPAAEAGLTPRQREVLGLLALGLTNAEIAARMGVGLPTVKTHISSLLRCLGLRDRTQLAVYACRRGMKAVEAERYYHCADTREAS